MNNDVYTIDEIKVLTKEVFKEYDIVRAYIFGSYSRNEANEKSDIDILVVSPDNFG